MSDRTSQALRVVRPSSKQTQDAEADGHPEPRLATREEPDHPARQNQDLSDRRKRAAPRFRSHHSEGRHQAKNSEDPRDQKRLPWQEVLPQGIARDKVEQGDQQRRQTLQHQKGYEHCRSSANADIGSIVPRSSLPGASGKRWQPWRR